MKRKPAKSKKGIINRSLSGLYHCGYLLLLLPLFLVQIPVASAASVYIEHSILDREQSPEFEQTDATGDAIIIRLGGQQRTSFIKLVELKYYRESYNNDSLSDKGLMRTLAVSTSTTRGDITKGLSIFSVGFSGIDYALSDEESLKFMGIQFSIGQVEPLYETRVFLKMQLNLDFWYQNLDDDSDDDSNLINARGELGIIYSYPKFDVGLSYSYRSLTVTESRPDFSSDSAHGVLGAVRFRF